MEPQLSAPYFVTALDRHKLGIELIVSIMRPFLSVQGLQYQATKEVLPPQDHNEERILTQIERMSSYAGKQLTTKQISLPLTKIRKELNTLLDYLNEEDFGPVASLPDTRSKGRRSTITDDDLLRVAVKYNELQGASGAVRVVAKSENLSENTISQYIRRARKAGFLEPTTAGKKNFNLTPKALRLFVDETR